MPLKTRLRENEETTPTDARGVFESSELSVLLMEDNFPWFTHLNAHALRITDQPESTPSTVPVQEWNPATMQIDYREVQRTQTYLMNVSYEVALPAFTSSKLLEIALAGARKDIVDYIPSNDYAERVASIFTPTVPYKEPTHSEDFHMGGADPSAARRSKATGSQTKTIKKIHGMVGNEVNDLGSNAIHAVAWMNPDYDGGRLEAPQNVIVGGDQLGATAPELLSVLSTVDARFDTNTDLDTGESAMFVTDIIVKGSAVIFTYTDDIDPTAAADGGIYIYKDGVFTECTLSGSPVATGMFALEWDKDTDRFIAVGAGGKIYAANKTTLTILSDLSDSGVTDDMVDIAIGNGLAYIATIDGNAYKTFRHISGRHHQCSCNHD